jgi:hypothetical protein
MRLYAFAALLALPLLGLISGAAKADYYCCGKNKGDGDEREVRYFLVVKKTAVFDCDAHHCETKTRLRPHTKIKAECRSYGWCKIEPDRVDSAWVPEHCLKEIGGHQKEEDYSEGEAEGEGYAEQDHVKYDRRPWRKY